MNYRVVLVAAILFAYCDSSGTKTKTVTPDALMTPVSTADNRKGTLIEVTLSGGENSGTYEVTSAESTCSMGLTGEKSFGNQYSETGKGEKELSNLQLIVDDFDEAKKGTNNFNMQLGFGSLVGGTSYILNPIKKSGTGKLTLKENGGVKVVSVEGTTKDGVGIKAVITCKTVQKMVDGQLKEE